MELVELIPTLGFPIVACIALAWYFTKIIEKFMEREDMVSEKHKEETEKFAEALNANTLVLQKLCERLDREVNNG